MLSSVSCCSLSLHQALALIVCSALEALAALQGQPARLSKLESPRLGAPSKHDTPKQRQAG